MYLLIFTGLTSLPLLGVILYMRRKFGIRNFLIIHVRHSPALTSFRGFLLVLVSLGFLVKFPMYFFHLWLPKAHVEASARGSILLAGVLLKLGAYGLYRFARLIREVRRMLIFFCVLGGALLRILCTRITDFKVLIAYSSVVHMSPVIVGIFSQSYLGRFRSLGMSLGHGVVSSAIFFGAGILYEKSNSRLILFNTGILR